MHTFIEHRQLMSWSLNTKGLINVCMCIPLTVDIEANVKLLPDTLLSITMSIHNPDLLRLSYQKGQKYGQTKSST